MRILRYWEFYYPPAGELEAHKRDESAYVEEFAAVFEEAVGLRMRADGNLGVVAHESDRLRISPAIKWGSTRPVTIFRSASMKRLSSRTTVPRVGVVSLIWLVKEKLKWGEGSFNEGFELLAGICLLLRMVKTTFGVRCELRGLTTIHMLHIVWSIIVGFIVGLLASAIMHTHLGLVLTTLLGIVGSVVGGLIARLFSRPPEGSKFHPAGFLMSIVGAIVVVFLVRLVG